MSRPLPVDNNLLDYLFLHMLRIDRIFQAVVANLQPAHLYPHEGHYRAILAAAAQHYERMGCMPALESIRTETRRLLERDETMGLQQMMEAESSLRVWYDKSVFPDEALEPSYAEECLRQVLLERTIGAAAQRLSNDMQLQGQVDYTGFAEAVYQKAAKIAQLQEKELPDTSPAEWVVTDNEKIPTGVRFVDDMLGGSEAGDTNVLLGPSGVAKTLFGIQMLCARGKQAYDYEQTTGEPGGLSVYFSYEDGLKSLRPRALSCACRIHKEHLENLKSLSELSTINTLHAYERQLFKGDSISCERQRYAENHVWLNKYTLLIDFSDSPEALGGKGGIPEIRSMLGMIQEKRKRPFDSFYFDYAGLIVTRMLEQRDGNTDRRVSELGGFVDKVRSQIAVPFGAVCWVIHQVNGKAQQASPTARLSHTNAEWCKGFANNAYAALVLGTKDINSNACMLAATKTRRGRTPKPIPVQICGELSCLNDASRELTVDGYVDQLKPIHEVAKLHGNRGPAARRHASTGVDYDDLAVET